MLSSCDIYKKSLVILRVKFWNVKHSCDMENMPKQIQIPWGTSKTNVNLPPSEENASEFTGSLGKKLRLQKYTNKKILRRSLKIFSITQIQYILRIQYNIINISSFCIPVKLVRIAVCSVVIPEMFVLYIRISYFRSVNVISWSKPILFNWKIHGNRMFTVRIQDSFFILKGGVVVTSCGVLSCDV